MAIPSSVELPSYRQSLALLPERMSLTTAVLVLAWFASRRLPKWEAPAAYILAAAFFALLYADAASASRIEYQIKATVRQLPQGSRVVSGLRMPSWRVDPISHQIDRACMGWCFSYGDYEPSTHQFRLRAVATNPIVLAEQADKQDLELGLYVVRKRDQRIYQIILLDRQRLKFGVREMMAGERVGLMRLDTVPD
jgi:hypothetical protein